MPLAMFVHFFQSQGLVWRVRLCLCLALALCFLIGQMYVILKPPHIQTLSPNEAQYLPQPHRHPS